MTATRRPFGCWERACLLAVLLTLPFMQATAAAPVLTDAWQSDIQSTVRHDGLFVWIAGHVSIRQADLADLRDAGADGPSGFALEAFVSKYLLAGLMTIEPSLPAQPVAATLDPPTPDIGPPPLFDAAVVPASRPVPEPATSTLLGVALLLAAIVGGRR